MIVLDYETDIPPRGEIPRPALLCMLRGDRIEAHTAGAMAPAVQAALDSEDTIVGHNIAFDLAVAREPERVVRAHDRGRVRDTMIRERLRQIRAGLPGGPLGLASLAARDLGVTLDKSTRDTFGPYVGAREIPRPMVEYCMRDVAATAAIWRDDDPLVASETRHAHWLHACGTRGVVTDPSAVAALRASIERDLAPLDTAARELGVLRSDGTRDVLRLRELVGSIGERTARGKPSTARATLEAHPDPRVRDIARMGTLRAWLARDVAAYETGLLTTRYGIADTLRTTSAKTNLQNFPRRDGFRECIVPRSGFVFLVADAGGLELGTVASVIADELGDDSIAAMIRGGVDLHKYVASVILSDTYDSTCARIQRGDLAAKEARQFAKIANFGFFGGMGPKTLVAFAAQQGVALDLARATALRELWRRTLPAAVRYLRWVGEQSNDQGHVAVLPGSGLVRTGLGYSQAANARFQALGAAVMKEIGWALYREQVIGALRGAHLVLFVHDEFVFEAPATDLDDAARTLARVMREGFAALLPRVKIKVQPVAMRRYSKRDTPRVENGRLIPWD